MCDVSRGCGRDGGFSRLQASLPRFESSVQRQLEPTTCSGTVNQHKSGHLHLTQRDGTSYSCRCDMRCELLHSQRISIMRLQSIGSNRESTLATSSVKCASRAAKTAWLILPLMNSSPADYPAIDLLARRQSECLLVLSGVRNRKAC